MMKDATVSARVQSDIKTEAEEILKRQQQLLLKRSKPIPHVKI